MLANTDGSALRQRFRQFVPKFVFAPRRLAGAIPILHQRERFVDREVKSADEMLCGYEGGFMPILTTNGR